MEPLMAFFDSFWNVWRMSGARIGIENWLKLRCVNTIAL